MLRPRAAMMFSLFLLIGIVLVAQQPDRGDAFRTAIRSNDLRALDALVKSEGANTTDADGVTPLMYATAVGSIDAVKRLVNARADVNARNKYGSTPLMWARDLDKAKALLDAGADVNAVSNAGRTALMAAAKTIGAADVVKLLLAKGADARVVDKYATSALHEAALTGDVDTLQLILDAGGDVHGRDSAKFTPLMMAASSGSMEATRILLSRGARVNDVSEQGEIFLHRPQRVQNGVLTEGNATALLLAAPGGSLELIRVLLDAGANVNATDIRGMTPLMLAVATDHSSVDKIQLLLARGADVRTKSLGGETVLDWAEKSGRTPLVALLKRVGAPSGATPAAIELRPSPVDLSEALRRGVAIMQTTSGGQFFARGGCSACHAQNIMDVIAPAARARGIHLDEQETARRLAVMKSRFAAWPTLLERLDSGGSPDTPAYTFAALAAGDYSADRMTDALVVNVAGQQMSNGSWHVGRGARPPIQDGDIFRTALLAHALTVYAPPALALEMNNRIARARRWLETAAAITNQDQAMRLLGLVWTGADSRMVGDAVTALLVGQRPDGGWAQRDELASDAYATGLSLYALATAREAPQTPALQRGIKFLLSTQQSDGSWYVRSRAPKIQPYFESGFPYGHDQWISQMATGWATAALALAADPPHTSSAGHR